MLYPLVALLVFVSTCAVAEDPVVAPAPSPAPVEAAPEPKAPLDFTLEGNDGKPYALSRHKGQVILLVNVASKCGFTPQYEGLQAVYQKYKDRGFVVIGIPSNDFGGQEPGSNADIKKFCTTKYKVTFPLLGKVHAKGPDISPFYKFMIKQGPKAGNIAWNFHKFLIGRDGQIIDRFASDIEPMGEEIAKAIEAALGASAPAAAQPASPQEPTPSPVPAPTAAPQAQPTADPKPDPQPPGRITVD